MRICRDFFPGALLLGLLTLPSLAQVTSAAPDNPRSREVRAVADALVTAMNQGDVAAALKFFHTNCLVTWCNAEVSRGHEGLHAFHERLLGGPAQRVESFNCEIKVDDAVNLYADGKVALASGAFNERFKQPGGRKIDLQGRWSVTLARPDDGWLIVNLQLSTDPFDNSLLSLAKQAGWVVGVVNLLIGAGAGWLISRRRNAAAKA